MKRIRSMWVVALALLVTVGGVYATWNYERQATMTEENQAINIGLTAKASIEHGTIAITTNTINVQIDDAGGDHVADDVTNDLVVDGDFAFTFTKSTDEGAPDSINVEWRLTAPTDYQFNSADVFTVSTDWTSAGSASTGVAQTIAADAIKAAITGMTAISLPTETDYDNFATASSGKTFTIELREAVTAAP